MIQLQDPRGIRLSGTTDQLLLQVTEASSAIEVHRPFSASLGTRLRNSLLPDRIVASLNMEGIVATRRQTLQVMDAMRISENVGRGELEIRNALQADEFIHDCVEQGHGVTAATIRQVNGLLLGDVHRDAGSYRTGHVELPGAPFTPPLHTDVPILVTQLVEMLPLGDSIHPIVQAAWVHAQLTLIHPFFDGNGRTGRLMQDFVLVRRGFLPVGIPPSQRDDYYRALELADQERWDSIVEILADLELRIIAKAEAVVKAPERRSAWISRLSEAASQKAKNTRHKQYLVWRHRMEKVTSAFATACLELDEMSEVIGAECKQFGVMDFADWQETCRSGYVPRNWLFSMLFYAEGKPFYKAIAVQMRHTSRAWDSFELQRDNVALYFTGVNTIDGAKRPPYRDYSDPHLRLRELVFLDDELHVFRQSDPESDWQCDPADNVDDVVQEYFLDMFGRKAGLAIPLEE